ncbi:MAG: Crp/Fnr family transcriptional regulator [Desulfobulbaceae bacterium]|nr:Crp/Fnr family transcriptional regulator [Desulfobulbaceae bacterium]
MNSYQEKNDLLAKSEFQENLDVLREVYFFSEFPLEVLKVFAYLCIREKYKEGDIIFSQNDDDGRAYYILSGQARLSRSHENKEVLVRTCGENTFFGAFTLAGMANRLFSLTALTNTCCLILTREKFQDTISQFPDSRQYIIQGLSDSIISWEEKYLNENINCDSCRSIMGVSLI